MQVEVDVEVEDDVVSLVSCDVLSLRAQYLLLIDPL